MQDNHPEISLYDIGDSVKEGLSDYRYKGKIIDKQWDEEKREWGYVVETGILKPFLLTQRWFSPSVETNRKVGERITKIKALESAEMTESKYSVKRFQQLAGVLTESKKVLKEGAALRADLLGKVQEVGSDTDILEKLVNAMSDSQAEELLGYVAEEYGINLEEQEDEDDYYDDDMDGDAESALASAGFGTDEDYGSYGGDDW
jgi:uncharacterized protein YicC (UPF0701 family)